MKLDKIRKQLWLLSLIVLGVSLLCPTYCSNDHCSDPLSGLVDLLTGWVAALFMGSTYFAWFANPFFITALILNKKHPIFSTIMSFVAILIALTFLKGGRVLLNEAGHMGYITKLQIGYWLWLISIIIMFFASIVAIFLKSKMNNSTEKLTSKK